MKKRIISAIVALAIVIPLVIVGGVWYNIGVGIISIIGLYEIMDAFEKEKKIPIIIKLLAVISYVLFIADSVSNKDFSISVATLAVPIILCFLPTLFYKEKYSVNDGFRLLSVIYLLGVSFGSLIFIRSLGVNYFIYLLLISIMSDTFAHFFGTQIGRYKLTPISPNKTIEGFVGGFILSVFISTCYFTTFNGGIPLILVIIMSSILSIMATFGDLIFSLIKREFKIKDFGNIMPGHGGILDRVDSILIVSIAFTIIMCFM